MYRFISFITVFLLLACTITAISAAMYEPPAAEPEKQAVNDGATEPDALPAEAPTERPTLPSVDEHAQSTQDYTPRLTAPDEDDPRYYSSDNIFYAADYGMPNCTCYAWGRAYEISGEKPELSPYDACTWYDYNSEYEIYDYGDEPRQGAIACWAYADGGSGHVAVVEEVEDDTVLLSNSAYSGDTFYLDTVPVDDPSQGRDNWIFQGYIYVDQ
ncbi:MAG: CHAP domain-containing protein [Ruminococcus sp.]|nr:CHAP domain-containing protein [Ruminococcus sp.]